MFTVSGIPRNPRLSGRREVTWHAGRLSGDETMMAAVRVRARELEGQQVGPHEGPYSGRNHLRYPISACIVIGDLFVPSTMELSGNVPERPPIPDGAIGSDVKGRGN